MAIFWIFLRRTTQPGENGFLPMEKGSGWVDPPDLYFPYFLPCLEGHFRAKFVYQKQLVMITKALLLLVIILLSAVKISADTRLFHGFESSREIPSADQGKNPQNKQQDNSTDFDVNHPSQHLPTQPGHHGEEDGKHHHFHFTRLIKRRSRRGWLVLSKSALVIVHLSVLLSIFMHLIH